MYVELQKSFYLLNMVLVFHQITKIYDTKLLYMHSSSQECMVWEYLYEACLLFVMYTAMGIGTGYELNFKM